MACMEWLTLSASIDKTGSGEEHQPLQERKEGIHRDALSRHIQTFLFFFIPKICSLFFSFRYSTKSLFFREIRVALLKK